MAHEHLKTQYEKDAAISQMPTLFGSSSTTTRNGKPATERLSGARTTNTVATLISVLEISVSANDTVTLVKEHRV